MRIVVTGGKGMLGRTIQNVLGPRHHLIVADLPEWNILDATAFERQLADAQPAAVIHCAAMTAVDRCESE